jgi:hypothetical protein
MLFSFSTEDYSRTYTDIDCFALGYGTTYQMEDYPGDGDQSTTTISSTLTATETITSSLSTSHTPSHTPVSSSNPTLPVEPIGGPTSIPSATAEAKTTPAGAIAGGVVGGLAVIVLLILGILYIIYRRKDALPPPATNADGNLGQYAPNHMAEYHDTSSQMAQNHNSFLSEMPGTVPDKAVWSPGMDSGGSPVQSQAYAMPAFDEIHDSYGGGGRDRMEIV